MERSKFIPLEEMDTEDLIDEYFEVFKEFPPRVVMVGAENEIYEKLLRKAIQIRQPISCQDINIAFDDVQLDVYRETDEDIYKKGLKHRLGED